VQWTPGGPGHDIQRILVVDDDTTLRELMRTVLERAGFAVSEASSGDEALALELAPDAALLDVRLPGISGYEVCRELRIRFGNELPIVFMSGTRTESLDRVAGLLIGADDYLVKPFEPDELLARLRSLLRRRAEKVGIAPSVDMNLTDREHEVLGLLAEGHTQREIARQLVISDKTVATHIQRILAKLGVHTRAQAVAVAYQTGLAGATEAHALLT